MKVSACVIALDEARDIEECLRSLSWADERIVVIDDRTRDDTERLARLHTDRVLRHPFESHAAQRAWTESQAGGEWIFWLDADERVPAPLRDEILRAVAREDVAAYRVPHLDRMFGRWIRHGGWYPQYHLRLYRRNRVRWEGAVHERPVPDGALGTLREPIEHFGHTSVAGWVQKMSDYTTLEAEELHRRGVRMGPARVVLEPVAYGLYKYVGQAGFLDGMHGVALAGLMTCYRFVRNLKVWDLARSAVPASRERRDR